MQPILTIFVAFTRRWALERWIDNLSSVQHDPALTNLCVIIDMDDHYIARAFKALAENKGYRSFHMKINDNWNPNEVRLSVRRMRVADIKNQSKDLVAACDGDIVLGFEDDTVFDRLESFAPLYQPLLDDPKVGFVEGVQMGRWGANMIGAWQANDPFEATEIKTCLPPYLGNPVKGELQWVSTSDITGGGFYGYATRKAQYLDHDYYTSSSQPWGPDVNYGFYLKQRGFTCLIDWTLIYGHNDHNIVGYPDKLKPKEHLVQLVYNKDNQTGKWMRTDHEQTRY